MNLIISSPYLTKKKTILRFATSILSPTKRLKTHDATQIASYRWVRTTLNSKEASTAKAFLRKIIDIKKVIQIPILKINQTSKTRARDLTGTSLSTYNNSSSSNYSRRAPSSNNWLPVRIIHTQCNMKHLKDAMKIMHIKTKKTKSTIKTLQKPITVRKVEIQETHTQVHSSMPMLLKSHRRKRCFDK